MAQKNIYNLAFDFGASSGRLMMSVFDGEKIELKEVHRFSNEPVWMNGRFYWDFPRLFLEMKNGLKKVSKMGLDIAGIAVDTWGVDFGYIDKDGQLLSNPLCYRDDRASSVVSEVEDIVSFKEFYDTMGIEKMDINSVYQLFYDIKNRKHIVDNADALLFMPDLFGFFLSGEKYSEYTIASTSQMLDAQSKDWAKDILNKLDIPTSIMQKIVKPGTVVGSLQQSVAKETELSSTIPIIAVGGHDTASAVCSAPLNSANSAYLSCGTWSLLGVETDEPIINEESFKYNYTNEGGIQGKICFLKNITGLWIIQQLKKKWSETNTNIGYSDIIEAAQNAENSDFIINPDDEIFNAPLNMVSAVKAYCNNNNQGEPDTMGEIAIAVYNGITNKYKEELNNIESITEKDIDVINMVGGGIQDQFLCQMTADVTGKKVIAGPVEASVLGNILMQLKALDYIKDIEQCREIIKNSFDMKEYVPKG